MRILMSNCGEPFQLECCYQRSLARFPITLRCINLSERPYWMPRGAAGRIFNRIYPHAAWRFASDALLAAVRDFGPDVIWIFKGAELYPSELSNLRGRGITLVNYNADHPFRYFSRGSGNNNVRRAIPQYHLHLTYSQQIAYELSQYLPGTRVAVVPFGHEVGDEVFKRIAGEDEINRACFVGNPDEHRRCSIMRLVGEGVPVDIYGNQWHRHVTPSPLLRLNGPVIGEEMLRILRRFRVQLNLFRPHNVSSHNMRTFEVPAVGGIMLAEDSGEHQAFFKSDCEAFYFSGHAEMVLRARQLLAMPKEQAMVVRLAARRRSVESRYSYVHRAEDALKAIFAAHTRRKQLQELAL
jgi:spore maturation protein CgeB